MKDYYSILGVSRNVSKEVLDAIYLNIIKNQDDNIDEVEEAYSILSDIDKRIEYDKRLDGDINDDIPFKEEIVPSKCDSVSSNPKKHKSNFLIALIGIVLIIFVIKILFSESHETNSIWGTFETVDGELLSVEMIEDCGDDLYTAYISRTEIPWVKEYVIIDLTSNEITYFLTEEKILFEFKNRKLFLNSKENGYKKISDDCEYKSILNKEQMTLNDIIGTYKNVDNVANIVISKSNSYGLVNIWVGDFIGNTLGYTKNIQYEDFFENGKVNITIDEKSFPIFFVGSKVIMCDAFQLYNGGFVKQETENNSDMNNPNYEQETSENDAVSSETNNQSAEESDTSNSSEAESIISQSGENTVDNLDEDKDTLENDITEDNSNQETEITEDILNEEYKWYLKNRLYANEDKTVRIEVYEVDNDHFTMIWGDVYWANEVEHNWNFIINNIPNEIGVDGEFIYNGEGGRIVYYPQEDYISVEMGDKNYDGIYELF